MKLKKLCKKYRLPDYPEREVFASCCMCANDPNPQAKACAVEAALYSKELYNHDMCWHPVGKK